MIADINYLPSIANDLTIRSNLIQATTMAILYPLLKDEIEYKQRLAKHKEQSNELEKRVSNLEARQTLTKVLLQVQLELENIPKISS